MAHIPSFHARFRVEELGVDEVLLHSDDGGILVSGAACGLVAGLIDGCRTDDEIVEALQDRVSPELAYYAIYELEAKGYVRDSHSIFSPSDRFWEHLGLEPSVAAARLSEASVELRALGTDDAGLRDALGELGIRTATADVGGDRELLVVVTSDYLHPELEPINRGQLKMGAHWMLVSPGGIASWIGPLFRPGVTGCWACLAQRLELNEVRRPGTLEPALASTRAAAVQLAATEIAKALTGQPSSVEGALASLDHTRLTIETHALTRRPQCPSCGNPPRSRDDTEAARAEPIVLASCPKVAFSDGGHRVCLPEETVRRLERHTSPVTGVVPGLFRGDGGGAPVQVYATRQRRPSLARGRQSFRRDGAMGKGLSDAQAKASCLGEAVERYSACCDGTEASFLSSLRELGESAVNPAVLMQFSASQYRERDKYDGASSRWSWVPAPFEENEPIAWCPAWSLTRGTTRYLPKTHTWIGVAPESQSLWGSDSNGVASGNRIEEAVLQGFLEVVERDALAIWWYNRLRRPGVDLASFSSTHLAALDRFFREQDRELHVLDLTTDLGITTFAAVSFHRDGSGILFGFGAHLEPDIALSRSLTELAQLYTYASSGSRSRSLEGQAEMDIDRWLDTVSVESQPHCVPAPGLERTREQFSRLSCDDIRDEVQACVDLAARHGLEVIVQDLTRPDLDFPVVRVTVPGLRPPWARFAPGRLFDVPVALGWLEAPLTEESLNPIPFFL